MGCFSLGWIEQLCIWLIVVCAVVAIIRLLVPFLTGMIGIPLVLWCVVAIMCVYIIFSLLECVLSAGGPLHFPTR